MSKANMMSEMFDCDICVMIYPRNSKDYEVEVGMPTTGMFLVDTIQLNVV